MISEELQLIDHVLQHQLIGLRRELPVDFSDYLLQFRSVVFPVYERLDKMGVHLQSPKGTVLRAILFSALRDSFPGFMDKVSKCITRFVQVKGT